MDELESVVVFDNEQSQNILRSLDLKKRALNTHVLVTAGAHGILRVYCFEMKGKDASSFTVTSLFSLPLSNLSPNISLSEEIANLKGISRLMFLPQKLLLTAITNDFNFASFSPAQFSSAVEHVQSTEEDSDAVFIRPNELLVSNHGDILDLIPLPVQSTSSVSDSMPVQFRLGLVSNSPQLRIVDEHMKTEVLEGHTDIILAADVSPDG
jgi:hypothetical protein